MTRTRSDNLASHRREALRVVSQTVKWSLVAVVLSGYFVLRLAGVLPRDLVSLLVVSIAMVWVLARVQAGKTALRTLQEQIEAVESEPDLRQQELASVGDK